VTSKNCKKIKRKRWRKYLVLEQRLEEDDEIGK
jgi:hypothetical protein